MIRSGLVPLGLLLEAFTALLPQAASTAPAVDEPASSTPPRVRNLRRENP